MLTLSDIMRAAENSAGSRFWFTPHTRRFFGSRTSSRVYPLPSGGALFVDSTHDWQRVRRYSVHHCDPHGEINVVGEIRQYATAARAHSAARREQRARRAAHDSARQAAAAIAATVVPQ